MTYGKAHPASRYMRSHPYRKEPCGSPRPDEEGVKTGDLWKAIGTIKNYVVSSVSQFVLRLTGSSKKPETKDDSTSTSDRVNGDALRESPRSLFNPNQLNANDFSSRQRMGYGENDPRRQMLLPQYQRPFVQNQSHYPYGDDRPQGLPYRPMNPRRRNMMSDVSPYVVKPYTYRRAWTSTAKSNARMSRLSNTNPFNRYGRSIGQSPISQRTTSYTEVDTTTLRHNYSPIYPRKLFSWERCRSKIEYKHEEGEQGERKVTLTYTDPCIQRAIDRAEAAGARNDEKKGLVGKRSFGARVIRSPNDDQDQTQKRKSYKTRGPESNSKRPKSLDIKEKSGLDLTITRCNDVDSMPMNESQPSSDVSRESEQKDAYYSDKMVGEIEVKESPKPPSLKLIPNASPAKSIQSSSLFASTSKTSEPASCSIFDTNKSMKNKSGLFDDVVGDKTVKPRLPSLSGPFSLPERKEQEMIPLIKANQSEDTVSKAKSMAKTNIENPLETGSKDTSSTTTAVPQKALETAADENISFACRMGRLKRIKIRDHYIQKIESLYDNKCTSKDMSAKKMKAVSMYKEKYHKLRDDHTFYTKLCKQYNVDPGEDYVGVDPDIKPEDNEQVEEKTEKAPETFSFKLKADTKPKIDPKPVMSKPHINPFATDSIKPAEQPAKKGFTFSGNLFSTGPAQPAKRKRGREGGSSANLFSVTTKPDLFSGTQSPTASATTNPFSPAAAAAAGSPSSSIFSTNPGKAKNNIFNSTNGALKSTSGGLFGISSNGGGTASMDSDVPSGNNNFGSANPFATKPGQTNNLFASTSNPFNMQQSSSSGAFGNTQRNANPFTTSSSGGAFGKPGAFNPGGLGKGDGPVFSLGNLAGKNKKRRTVVRGRRTLP